MFEVRVEGDQGVKTIDEDSDDHNQLINNGYIDMGECNIKSGETQAAGVDRFKV